MKAPQGFTVLAFAAVIGAAGCGRNSTPTEPTAAASLSDVVAARADYNPVIVASDFSNTIDNPLLPFVPGTVYHYHQADGSETNDVTVTNDHKVVMGITVRVVHDQVFNAEGKLTEDTFDWYAQHTDGTVWYFGEDTKTLDGNGNVLTTQGSWEAGINGGKPGILMLANPKVGDSYRQEFMPGVVADMGKVLSLKETASVPAGTFSNCLETVEWTPLEPGDRANKFYVRGIGPVLELSNHGHAERLELVSVTPPHK